MALPSDSPAVDYIPAGVASNPCPAVGGTDQRGYSRPDVNEAYCDIGAYECQDTEFPTGNGQNAYDIESSNFYCTGGGTACVPSGSVASECFSLALCSGVNCGDAEAFGRPNNTTYGIPDELVLACVHGTSTGYDIGRGVRGSMTGGQNTDNDANRLNNGTFTVTLTGTSWHVDITGTYALADPYSGTLSCTISGAHGYDLLNTGKDTSAAEGELENTLGDNLFAQGLATPPYSA